MTIGVIVSQVALANEKALRLHPAQNAPQGVSSLRTHIQTRLRNSKDVPEMPAGNASMRVRMRTNGALDSKICARSQPALRKTLEKANQALRVRVWNDDPCVWPTPRPTSAFCEWPQRTQSGNRSLACSVRRALCLRMRQADQAQPASVETRGVSLHLGPQSGCARRSSLRMEGRVLTPQTPDRKPQGLSSLASSGAQEGPLHLPEVRCEAEFGSGPHGRLFRDRCPDRRRPSSNPRLSHPRDRNNPLPRLSPRQGNSVASLPSENPIHQVPKTDQRSHGSVSRSGDPEPRNLNASLPLKPTARLAWEQHESVS